MRRRAFFTKSSALAGALSLIGLPVIARSQKPAIKGRFIHMVFFWLRPDTNQKQFIQSTSAFLDQVEVVRSYHLGTPAMTPRDIVDNSYSVSLVVTFDSKEDQDIYQKHPIHVKYVEENNHLWTSVKIYDSWGV